MDFGKEIFGLMEYVLRLKEIPRSGWNKKFPDGGKYKSRAVKDAESVADHSYGTAMLALFLSPHLEYDRSTIVEMALVHDLMEAITGDLATLSMASEEREEALRLKREKELEIINDLASLGGYGERIAELWQEMDANESREAQILHQLDKLEMDFQAVRYLRQGHELDASEFIESTRDIIQDPKLKTLIDSLTIS